MSRRIIDTMVVEMGSVIPDDVFIISASTTPNGRIALIVERDEVLEEALGDEVWTEDEVADWVGLTDEDLDAVLEVRGLIYERSEGA